MKIKVLWVTTFFFAVIALLSSCSCGNRETLMVASETRTCFGVGKHQCMLIKNASSDPWLFFNGSIKGFMYEPGYEYVLEVKKTEVKNPAQDASSVEYRLLKVVSKEPKVSEGMPSEVN